MALILTQKLQRNGWPEDEPLQWMDESLLVKVEGVIDNDVEYTTWYEYRLDGKIVKRGAHVTVKQNVLANGIAEMLR